MNEEVTRTAAGIQGLGPQEWAPSFPGVEEVAVSSWISQIATP